MAEDTPPPPEGGKAKGSFFKKNKTYIMIAGGAVVILMLYLLSRKSSSGSAATTADTTSTTAANGAIDPSTGYLYGSTADLAAQGASGATAGVPGPAGPTGATGATGPAASSPDVYNSKGADLGQYKYGSDELSYIQANIGSYGFTQAIYQDVLNRYNQIKAKYGQAAADSYHYGWSGPGKVSTVSSAGTPGPAITPTKTAASTGITATPKAAVISTKATVIKPNTTSITH